MFCFSEIKLLLQIITKYIFQLYSISIFFNLYSYAFHLLYRIQHAMLHSFNRCIRVKQIKHIVGQSRVYEIFMHKRFRRVTSILTPARCICVNVCIY